MYWLCKKHIETAHALRYHVLLLLRIVKLLQYLLCLTLHLQSYSSALEIEDLKRTQLSELNPMLLLSFAAFAFSLSIGTVT